MQSGSGQVEPGQTGRVRRWTGRVRTETGTVRRDR